jgi:hypothetical protein
MSKQINSEFDMQARIAKSFDELVKSKVNNHQALNDIEIKHLCPVAFKDKMTKAEINKLGLSKHYSFVPTINVINDFRSLGYEVVDAKQVKARKKSTNGYQKHLITFEHPKHKAENKEEYPQILLTNSHDGSNAFTLSAGIFRLVCSNGLVIKAEDYGSARLVHKGYSFEAVQKLVKEFEKTANEALTKVKAMKEVDLTKDLQIEFAKEAALLRFKSKSFNMDNIGKVVDLDDILNAERKEDEGNKLWEVFNRVQESIINGKFHYLSNTKRRKARPIKNFKQNIEVNKKLSELAFALV